MDATKPLLYCYTHFLYLCHVYPGFSNIASKTAKRTGTKLSGIPMQSETQMRICDIVMGISGPEPIKGDSRSIMSSFVSSKVDI